MLIRAMQQHGHLVLPSPSRSPSRLLSSRSDNDSSRDHVYLRSLRPDHRLLTRLEVRRGSSRAQRRASFFVHHPSHRVCILLSLVFDINHGTISSTKFLCCLCQDISLLCPANSHLDPRGGVSRMRTTITAIGWACTTLLHHSPHRRHNRTTTSPWFLHVTFGHRTGECGRRLTHHLRVVADTSLYELRLVYLSTRLYIYVETCLSIYVPDLVISMFRLVYLSMY